MQVVIAMAVDTMRSARTIVVRGVGMSSQLLAHLMEPLHTTECGGTDLGMPIERRMLKDPAATLTITR